MAVKPYDKEKAVQEIKAALDVLIHESLPIVVMDAEKHLEVALKALGGAVSKCELCKEDTKSLYIVLLGLKRKHTVCKNCVDRLREIADQLTK